MSNFPSYNEVVYFHDQQIANFGGSSGIRDLGLLKSGLARAQSGYYSSILEEAAAVWESLSQNHPFVDGNKRAAFAALDTFLRVNDQSLKASSQEIITFVMDLYSKNEFKYSNLLHWLQSNTVLAGIKKGD